MNSSFETTKGVHVDVPLFLVSVLYFSSFKVLVDCNHSIKTNHTGLFFCFSGLRAQTLLLISDCSV